MPHADMIPLLLQFGYRILQRMFRQRPYRAFLTSDVGLGDIQVLLLANMMHLS